MQGTRDKDQSASGMPQLLALLADEDNDTEEAFEDAKEYDYPDSSLASLPKALPDVRHDAKKYETAVKLLAPIELPVSIQGSIPADIRDSAFEHLIMVEPVFVEESGEVYEKASLLRWLEATDEDPRNRKKITKKTGFPVVMQIKRAVTAFLEKNPEVRNSAELYLPHTWVAQLEQACIQGDITAIKRLATTDQGDPRLISWKFESDKRMLHLACERGTLEAVRELVRLAEKRAEGLGLLLLLQPDKADKLPIHYAMLPGRDPRLMRYVAALMGKELARVESLPVALSGRAVQSEMTRQVTARHLAAMNNDVTTLQTLGSDMSSLDIQNSTGHTALHCAAGYGAVGALRFLVEAGASMDVEDDEEQIPQSYAEVCGQASAVALFKTLLQEQDTQYRAAGPLGLVLIKTRRDRILWREKVKELQKSSKELQATVVAQQEELTAMRKAYDELKAELHTQMGIADQKLGYLRESHRTLSRWEHASPLTSAKTLRQTVINELPKNPLAREAQFMFWDSKSKNEYKTEQILLTPTGFPVLLARLSDDRFVATAKSPLQMWDIVKGTPAGIPCEREVKSNAAYLVYVDDKDSSEKWQEIIEKLAEDNDLLGKSFYIYLRFSTRVSCASFVNGVLSVAGAVNLLSSSGKFARLDEIIDSIDRRPGKNGYLLLTPEAVEIIDKNTTSGTMKHLPSMFYSRSHSYYSGYPYTSYPDYRINYSPYQFGIPSALIVLPNGHVVTGTSKISQVLIEPVYLQGNTYNINLPENNHIEVWEATRGRRIRCLERSSPALVDALLPLKDGRFLEVSTNVRFEPKEKSTSFYSGLYIASEKSDAKIPTALINVKRIHCLGLLSTGQIVIGSSDYNLYIFDLEKNIIVKTLKGHKNPVTAIAVAPDIDQVVSGSQDGYLRVWDVAQGICKQDLSGHSTWFGKDDAVNAIVYFFNNLVASASNDNTVKIWDLSKGVCIATLLHSSAVKSIIPLAEGKMITSSADGSIQLWRGMRAIKLDLAFQSRLVAVDAQIAISNKHLVLTTASPCEKELRACGAALQALCPDQELTFVFTPKQLTISDIVGTALYAEIEAVCIAFGARKQAHIKEKTDSFGGAYHLSALTSTPGPADRQSIAISTEPLSRKK